MTARTGDRPDAHADTAQYTNIAKDNSRVGVQAGFIHGNVTVYQLSKDASPEEKYQVGRNYLTGNMPRQAENLIRDAVMAGHTSAEINYHWALAMLSDRSFDDLRDEQFHGLSQAFAQTEQHSSNEWRSALNVVGRLMWCLTAQEQRGDTDPVEFSAVLKEYGQLAEVRRDEIRRHLDKILAGAIQDQLDALDAAEVLSYRMCNNRESRVWKFFEPEPTPPTALIPKPPMIGPTDWIKFVGGSLIGGLGAILALRMMPAASITATVVVVLLSGAGGYCTARFGLQRLALLDQRVAKNDEYGSPFRTVWSGAQEWIASTDFARAVAAIVDIWFDEHAPTDDEARGRWVTDTAGIGSTLKKRLDQLYGESGVSAGSIAWLIRWHAGDVANRWKDGRLYDFRKKLRVPPLTTLGFFAGLITLGIGGFLCLVTMMQVSFLGAVGIAILLGLGSWLATVGGTTIHREKQRFASEQRDSQDRLRQEQEAYRQWQAQLADRPSDAEMARWLDYDKRHLKNSAMKHYGLTNRDVIAHIVLTEAAQDCRRARVLYGPPRYSEYVVMVFLLTVGGVRQVVVNLDFASGAAHNERRTTFRYDAIASARVTEVGVRFHGERRSVIVLDDDNRTHDGDANALILGRAFRLSLINGQPITVIVENFDQGLVDRMQEDPRRLYELALDTSGISGALRILEAIAAEGREWLEHERTRRQRRLLDYQRRQAASQEELEPPPNPPAAIDGPR